ASSVRNVGVIDELGVSVEIKAVDQAFRAETVGCECREPYSVRYGCNPREDQVQHKEPPHDSLLLPDASCAFSENPLPLSHLFFVLSCQPYRQLSQKLNNDDPITRNLVGGTAVRPINIAVIERILV